MPISCANIAKKCIYWLQQFENLVLVFLLSTLLLLALYQIFLRNFFGSGLIWADGLLRILVLWLGLVGAMVAARENAHIRIDLLSRYLPVRLLRKSEASSMLFASLICALITFHSLQFTLMEFSDGGYLQAKIPAWVAVSIIPTAFASFTVRFCIFFIAAVKGVDLKPGQTNKNPNA